MLFADLMGFGLRCVELLAHGFQSFLRGLCGRRPSVRTRVRFWVRVWLSAFFFVRFRRSSSWRAIEMRELARLISSDARRDS